LAASPTANLLVPSHPSIFPLITPAVLPNTNTNPSIIVPIVTHTVPNLALLKKPIIKITLLLNVATMFLTMSIMTTFEHNPLSARAVLYKNPNCNTLTKNPKIILTSLLLPPIFTITINNTILLTKTATYILIIIIQ
jgi:hypothetical protein